MRRLQVTLCYLLFALTLAGPASAGSYVGDELVVGFRADADARDREQALAHRRAARVEALGARGPELVRLQPGDSVALAAAALERDPDVLFAEPNYLYRAERLPNDPMYADLWGLDTIEAPLAWDTATGSASVVAAVVDTGVAYTHPDLSANIWSNPGETLNGADDDGNGRVDDVRGWDAADDDADPDDEHGHGTHVAGTIGARGDNGVGVSGVAWQVSVMPLRAAGSDGFFAAADIVEAFNYACAKNARIVNGSFGGEGDSLAIRTAIQNCPSTLFVFAAGNGGGDGVGDDNDVLPTYPCSYPHANIVCVAATGNSGLASFSNFGASSVDVGAPGVHILSTWPSTDYGSPGTGYGFGDGTSMAAPHAAGAAALVAAHRPSLSAIELRSALLNGVTPLPALAGKVSTGGMLNVRAALTAPTTPPPGSPPPPPPPAPLPPPPPPPAVGDSTAPIDPALISTSHTPGVPSRTAVVRVTWSGAADFGSGVDGYSFHWASTSGATPDRVKDAEESTSAVSSATLAPGMHYFHLRTRDNAGNWSQGVHLGPFVVQAPPGGTTAPGGRCVVPRLKGKTLRAAKRSLRRAGCALGGVGKEYSRIRRGRVVRQWPRAGTRLRKGARISISLSRGRRPGR